MSESVSRGLIDLLSIRGRGCVAVLEAYLDEAGTHRGAKLLCVAGYVGNRKEWLAFEKEWQKQLDKAKIACFHAKEPGSKRLQLPLAEAIDKRKLIAVVCSVEPSIFNQHANAQFKSHLGNAYAACALMCAIEICRQTKENKLGSVSFVYEMGQPNDEYVRQVIEGFGLDNNINLSSVATEKKTDFLPLQAADFLSHACSTLDNNWFPYLMRGNNRYYWDITADDLNKLSKLVKSAIGRLRKLRRSIRKELSSS